MYFWMGVNFFSWEQQSNIFDEILKNEFSIFLSPTKFFCVRGVKSFLCQEVVEGADFIQT